MYINKKILIHSISNENKFLKKNFTLYFSICLKPFLLFNIFLTKIIIMFNIKLSLYIAKKNLQFYASLRVFFLILSDLLRIIIYFEVFRYMLIFKKFFGANVTKLFFDKAYLCIAIFIVTQNTFCCALYYRKIQHIINLLCKIFFWFWNLFIIA